VQVSFRTPPLVLGVMACVDVPPRVDALSGAIVCYWFVDRLMIGQDVV